MTTKPPLEELQKHNTMKRPFTADNVTYKKIRAIADAIITADDELDDLTFMTIQELIAQKEAAERLNKTYAKIQDAFQP